MYSPILTLIQTTYIPNEIGVQVPNEVPREILGTRNNLTRSEFFAAGSTGLKPSFMFRTPKENYNGEKIAEYMGQRFSVYRTYESGNQIEIYLEEKAGI